MGPCWVKKTGLARGLGGSVAGRAVRRDQGHIVYATFAGGTQRASGADATKWDLAGVTKGALGVDALKKSRYRNFHPPRFRRGASPRGHPEEVSISRLSSSNLEKVLISLLYLPRCAGESAEKPPRHGHLEKSGVALPMFV